MKKIVLITGASAGIGKATALLLLEKGYIVYAAARRVAKMNDLLALGAKILEMDVTDETSMTHGIDTIIRTEGRIDVLINNAGFGSYGALEDVPMSDARYQLEVNLFGPARLIQLALPHMRRQRSGKIVNVSSIGGKAAMPLGGWYHASKFALEAYSDSLRMEVRSFGIDVIVIEPGGIQSEWGDIAINNMIKLSADTAYQRLIDGAVRMTEKMKTNKKAAAPPSLIAELILKAIIAAEPRARYSAGYMSGTVLFMKKWLSDKMIDKMVMRQLIPS
jgi:NAD(P)-dependent dehydrogenase (short-subunit alcohol dehydrogenase family)